MNGLGFVWILIQQYSSLHCSCQNVQKSVYVLQMGKLESHTNIVCTWILFDFPLKTTFFFTATNWEDSDYFQRVWWSWCPHYQRGVREQDAGGSAGNERAARQATPGSQRRSGNYLWTTGSVNFHSIHILLF